MDTVNNWKRILLQWIKKCNFLDKPFYSIEQSEIEIFFVKFKEYIKGDFEKNDLCSFLKESYPSFEPHFDDENALSSSDYIYVYSLLLHFSCVKCPDEFFQQKCQELNESDQQNIATFFKKVFELENLSKQSLRHVIASSAMSPMNSSIQLMFMDSPIKTPRKNDISPPTPRSCILRERNKELINLKTQLENEIYEKGILELEVKQNQEKIIKLNNELKKSHHELQNLRNDDISRNTECNIELKYSEDQINRKLCKQISQKEQEICQQREDIDALTEQKNAITEKLIHAEKQIKIDQARIEEFAIRVDELVTELERKEVTIQYLSEIKLELEQYISEVRSSSASSRPDLNVSAECLDLSRTTNSSGSINSPENLGCSVVDIQLREKENENSHLRDELAVFHVNNSKLSKHMRDLTAKYSNIFDCESVIFDPETSDPIEHFLIFANYVDKFVQKYDENCLALKELKEYSNVIETENRLLSSKLIESENDVFNHKSEINNILTNNKYLDNTIESLKSKTKEWESRFAIIFKEKIGMEKIIESLQLQIEDLKHDFNIKNQKDTDRNAKLKADLDNKNVIVNSLESESIENKRQIENLILDNMNMKIHFETIHNLEKKNIDSKENEKIEEIVGLKKENNDMRAELEELKNKLDCLLNEKNEIQYKHGETEKTNVSLKKLLEASDQSVLKYLGEVKNQQYLISMLNIEKHTLLNSIQLRVDSFKTIIDELDSSFERKMFKLVEENEVLAQKVSRAETSFEMQTKKLNDISGLYSQTKNIINELKTGLHEVLDKYNLSNKIATNTSERSLFYVPPHSSDAADNLKLHLNVLVKELENLYGKNTKNESMLVSLLQKKDLEEKLVASERRIIELREDLESEKQSEINKLTNEVRRLNENIINIENVCDHLTNQNTTLQSKLSEYQAMADKLTEKNNLLVKNTLLETDKSHQLSIADKLMNTESKLGTQVLNMQAAAKTLDLDIEAVQRLLVVKTKDAEALFEERNQAECKIASMKKHIIQLESKINASNKIVEERSIEQCYQLNNLKGQLQNETTKKNEISTELELIIGQVNELRKEKIASDAKFQAMENQLGKYRSELDCSKTELHKLKVAETKLVDENKNMKETNILNEARIDRFKKELMEQKENVSRLIKEIASIRKEKDYLKDESIDLQKSLEAKNNAHTLLDSQHNMTFEKLQLVEKDLLTKQNLLNSEQLKSTELENQLSKLQMENIKHKETIETNVKRMEKQALKLGETQAQSLRFKKEAETALNNLEFLKSSSEVVQRENNKLNLECKSLKDKLAKCEKNIDQLESKLQQLENEKHILCSEKENVEVSEKELKSAQVLLEKNKSNLEDKVRKLAKSLSDANVALSRLEQDKVNLNLEIGGLNIELKEFKSQLCLKSSEIKDVTLNLIEVKNTNLKLMDLHEKLQLNTTQIQDENIRLSDELSKIYLRLSIAQEGYDNTKTELDALRSNIIKNKHETEAVEKEHIAAKERLKEIEERQKTESELFEKNKCLEEQIVKLSSDNRRLEEARRQERQTNEKLNTDISILQAKLHKSRLKCEENERKWSGEKDQLLSEVKASDERIKETRLELEGKLEKMKTKMKTLYNDEIAKMKKKQEREIHIMKSDIDSLKAQIDKYEENTKKLASQIFRLNENILEYQKQNTFLQTKLKDMDTEPHKINRVVSSHISQSTNHHALGSNLHMEDEEGEVFNNTYLSDLKNGKMPEAFGRGISPQELQHRNSLRPPHLKTAYFAQYDHQMGEDEIRDIPNLDDSLSTLLNTGQRKKISGATSYKRPGPPTPSKNAGRLSFGGIGEPSREILREALDVGNTHSSLKTPAKFKLFSSRQSIKDEYKKCLPKHSRRKQILGTIQCSSTPRKSKAHFDQRRILDQIMAASRSGRGNLVDVYNSPDPNHPSSLTCLELVKKKSTKYRRSKLSSGGKESETSDIRSHKYKSDKLEYGSKSKGRRCSINLKGCMFARNSYASKNDFRDAYKNRSKMQRNAHFNEYRRQVLNTSSKSPDRPSSNTSDSNNETNETDYDEPREKHPAKQKKIK